MYLSTILAFLVKNTYVYGIGYIDILQPISNAIKLFTRVQTFTLISNYIFYYSLFFKHIKLFL